MKDFYEKVIDWVYKTNPEVVISAHNHNDMGNAVANTIALIYAAESYAIKHNARIKVQVETTICGLGERAGNADIFPFMLWAETTTPEFESDVSWQFNREMSKSTANYVFKMANYVEDKNGLYVPRQSPVVGYSVNKHGSGIHTDAIEKGGHELYTIGNPMDYGHNENAKYIPGIYQGKAGKKAIDERRNSIQ